MNNLIIAVMLIISAMLLGYFFISSLFSIAAKGEPSVYDCIGIMSSFIATILIIVGLLIYDI